MFYVFMGLVCYFIGYFFGKLFGNCKERNPNPRPDTQHNMMDREY